MTVQDSTLDAKTRHGSIGGFQADVRLEPGVDYVATQPNGEAAGGGFDLAELARQVTGRLGDSSNSEGGSVPEYSVVELGDGNIEAVPQLFFEGANDLAAVFERLRVLDGEFKGEGGERHGGKSTEV
jgi:hypothetical protein